MERLAAGTDKEEGVAEAEGRDSHVSGSGDGTSKHAPWPCGPTRPRLHSRSRCRVSRSRAPGLWKLVGAWRWICAKVAYNESGRSWQQG